MGGHLPGSAPGDDDGTPDPFDGLVLDEDFVRGARLREAAAHERRAAPPAPPDRPPPPSAPRHFPARDRHPSGQRPPADDRSRRLARDGWDDATDSSLRRRRHSTVLRMIAVLLVASMVVVYALSHLATLWGRPPTVEGSIVGVEQPVSVSVSVDGEVLVAQQG